MKLYLSIILALTSLSSFAFEGIYKFDLAAEAIELQVNSDGSFKVLSNPRDLFTVALRLDERKLDITFSWINDASPELSRVILMKNQEGEIRIKDSYTVYNDGDPALVEGGVELLSIR